ncbi:hypothetical protein VFPFJ_02892 [Purpureocillium lilacinum]|uniref:Uncharacterized protein n=1 Tax=Purpureocillium lilacinum TaxID=33203 RepID=A0A179HWH3_PURLI|nr:hypothetical protein VFPFJ_02892 [Purpureocillium lilacinum]OAQ78532.1 hypothetical protein VFPBJ_06653 [Purpureocillium lilacinum]OAQ93730.1 hypothetical protein VFPFJ_02892 [Purpureocillium lilacinum]GJN81996.1 hypothetical protein PLIIFM63780_005532 [Purpureocillium lilacinum]
MVVCKRSCSASRPPAKKLKLTHPETRPESFWNSLASTPLTKGALQEQTRRLGSVEPNFHYLDDFMLSPELPDECSRKLRKFSMHGGPDMRDVVGYCCYIEVEEDEEEDLYDPATTVSEVDEDGPYDAAFAQHLVDHGVVPKGVFPHGFVDPTGSKSPSQPDNLSELHKVSCRRRASLAGSDPGYDEFVKTDDLVNDGMETPEALLPLLEGSSNQCETIGGGVPFSNLDHLTDGSLVAAQPGTYHGVLQNTFRPRVLAKLRQQIVPSLDRWDPVLPTVFLEAKSPNACEKASVCQMLYTMALGARAYRSLQDAAGGRGPVRIDHGAYTFGAVYRCGWLQLFACYVRERNKKGWCVPVLLGEWDIRANSQSFCDGMAAYRNVRDWAAAKRVELVQQANDCC